MVICHRRIGEAVKLRKAIYIFPHLSVIGMENMGAVLMHVNAFYLFRVYISRNIRALVNNQDFFAGRLCLMGKHSTEKACANNQKIIFLI